MNMDEHSLVQIGLEKLNQIRPIIKNAGYVEQQDWLQKAEQQKTTELKEEIKEIKAREKERNRDFKDVLTEQFLETMVTFFNCNRKELMFKLALFFQDKNLEEIDTIIKDKQMKLKDEMAAQK
jgi:predicted N-acyltransferase